MQRSWFLKKRARHDTTAKDVRLNVLDSLHRKSATVKEARRQHGDQIATAKNIKVLLDDLSTFLTHS